MRKPSTSGTSSKADLGAPNDPTQDELQRLCSPHGAFPRGSGSAGGVGRVGGGLVRVGQVGYEKGTEVY